MNTITPEQKLTIIKHLAGGKDADLVATIMHTTREVIIDVAKGHGYPDTDKLAWAADVLAKKLEEDGAGFNPEPLAKDGVRVDLGSTFGKSTTTVTPGATIAAVPSSDDVLALLNKAKGHTSKRIQNAADKALDAIAKVRQMVADDEARNAERRKAEKSRREARAEVERLEAQLAAAKAKLRGKATTTESGEHVCGECSRSFGSAQGLSVHIGRAHTEAAAS